MEVVEQVRAVTLEACVTNKRRRLDSAVQPLLLPKPYPSNSVSPTTAFEFPHHISPTSLKNQSMTNSSDLKAHKNSGSDEISISSRDGFSSDEKTEEVMESMTKKKRKISPASSKMPTTEEIEEFFSVAEKCEKKRFMEKYNYDIVKDVALEGKYQWVRLRP